MYMYRATYVRGFGGLLLPSIIVPEELKSSRTENRIQRHRKLNMEGLRFRVLRNENSLQESNLEMFTEAISSSP